MDALAYTRDDLEYMRLRQILKEEAGLIDVNRGSPGEGKPLGTGNYDLVIVALEGDEGSRTVEEWSSADSQTQVIWISNNEDHLKEAFRYHIYDCIMRPYKEDRVREAIRSVLPKCPGRYRWILPGRPAQVHKE